MNKQLTHDEEAYITLFCEGDGSLDTFNTHPRTTFWNTEKFLLDYIQSLVGGKVNPRKDGGYYLQLFGSHCVPLLRVFSKHIVSRQSLDKLNVLNGICNLPPATQHPIDLDGLTGFWDAEGSSGYSGTLSLHLTQKDREILDIIANTFNGTVFPDKNVFRWSLSGERARELTQELLKRSHHPTKKEQLLSHLFPTKEAKEKVSAHHYAYYHKNEEKQQKYHNEYNRAYRQQKQLINAAIEKLKRDNPRHFEELQTQARTEVAAPPKPRIVTRYPTRLRPSFDVDEFIRQHHTQSYYIHTKDAFGSTHLYFESLNEESPESVLTRLHPKFTERNEQIVKVEKCQCPLCQNLN